MEYKLVSPRVALGETLISIAEKNPDLIVLDPDLCPSSCLDEFAVRYPQRFIEGGIAEQNLLGVAAGLSTTGFVPFFVGFGIFTSQRVADQLHTSVAYPKANVKIVGTYSGFCGVKNGVTHQPIADLAFIRALPQVVVVEPADAIEVDQAIRKAYEYKGPVYIRLGRDPIPVIFGEKHSFTFGCGYQMTTGDDLTIASTGIMLSYALKAGEILAKDGIKCRVLHLPTIKPLDREVLRKAAIETGAIVTVENHNIMGGFGSAVTEAVSEDYPVPVFRCGIPDVFGESGYFDELADKYGFGTSGIVNCARMALSKKNDRKQ